MIAVRPLLGGVELVAPLAIVPALFCGHRVARGNSGLGGCTEHVGLSRRLPSEVRKPRVRNRSRSRVVIRPDEHVAPLPTHQDLEPIPGEIGTRDRRSKGFHVKLATRHPITVSPLALKVLSSSGSH
jgi:hypothetical protein